MEKCSFKDSGLEMLLFQCCLFQPVKKSPSCPSKLSFFKFYETFMLISDVNFWFVIFIIFCQYLVSIFQRVP